MLILKSHKIVTVSVLSDQQSKTERFSLFYLNILTVNKELACYIGMNCIVCLDRQVM